MRSRRRDTSVAFAVMVADPDASDARPSPQLLASARDRLWGLLTDDDELWVELDGAVMVTLGHSPHSSRRHRISSMTANLARRPLRDGAAEVHIDVGVAWAPSTGRSAVAVPQLVEHARQGLIERDLQARRWRSTSNRSRTRRPRTLLQLGIVLVATFVVPLMAMIVGDRVGIAVAGTLYAIVVAAAVLSSVLMWTETALGLLSRPDPPPSMYPSPPASAIIAAYLPNEASTILETLHVFLRHEYAGGLQVVLAYNTSTRLPIEDELTALARIEPRLKLVKVADSHSKAQNVNAALGVITGEFVGIFDADHHPDPGSFERASRWLAGDVDVVQGHCVVRNGDTSLVARTAAVEFEQIYAVSHRGRQLLHGFGIFGGSNGYWKTDLLRTVRMVPAMLTEDIDCSVRATRGGARIVNDPGLISRELAPETVGTLWRQRMRWAQGWAQVTAVHSAVVFHRDELSHHQRVGMFFHLWWREAYPLVSALMWPILTFYLWRDGGIGFSQPLWVMISVVTLATAPVQVILARRVADRRIARRSGWWAWYIVISVVIYQEFKNTIARIALVKLAMGERNWVVTPRSAVRLRSRGAHRHTPTRRWRPARAVRSRVPAAAG